MCIVSSPDRYPSIQLQPAAIPGVSRRCVGTPPLSLIPVNQSINLPGDQLRPAPQLHNGNGGSSNGGQGQRRPAAAAAAAAVRTRGRALLCAAASPVSLLLSHCTAPSSPPPRAPLLPAAPSTLLIRRSRFLAGSRQARVRAHVHPPLCARRPAATPSSSTRGTEQQPRR